MSSLSLSLLSPQLNLRVRDQRVVNEQRATATLTVNIIRDDEDPVFTNLPFTQSVNRNTAAGSSVYTVTARDDDLRVSAHF